MPKLYRDFLLKGPAWMGTGAGSAWARGIGDLMDSLVYRVKSSVKARFPRLESSGDAVAALGSERGITKGVGETNALFAERVRTSWSAHLWVGTPKGLLRALYYAGFTDVQLITQKGRTYTLDANLEPVEVVQGVEYTFTPNFWNSFAVYIRTLPAAWGGVIPATTSSEANNVRAIIKRWKPAFARLHVIKIKQTGLFWGAPGLKWGTAAKWGGTNVTWLP